MYGINRQGTQCSPELALRSTDFCAPESLIFSVLPLHFLWWQNGDLFKKLIDYEMYVHDTGGSSSPSCSNYIIKRMSIDVSC